MRSKWILGAGLALALGILAAGCGIIPPTPTPPPTETPIPTPTLTPVPTPTKGVELQGDSTRLTGERADLTGDGTEDEVVAFQTGDVYGLAIDNWQTEFPQGYTFSELQLIPIVYNTPPSVFVFLDGDDGVSKYLYVYSWDGTEGVLLSPQGGPLDGEPAFRSAYGVPSVDDGDESGTMEIAVLQEADNPAFLIVVYYEWLDGAYRHSTMFMSIPRVAPTPAS